MTATEEAASMHVISRGVRIGRTVGWALCLVWLVSCGGRGPEGNDAAAEATPIAAAADAAPAPAAPVPDREPSADEVHRAFFDLYEKLDVAGGLPVTLTASGQSTVLRAKLFDARKQSCRTLPHAKPGEWECEAELMMSLCSGDCDPADEEPSSKGERIHLRWDADAERYAHDG